MGNCPLNRVWPTGIIHAPEFNTLTLGRSSVLSRWKLHFIYPVFKNHFRVVHVLENHRVWEESHVSHLMDTSILNTTSCFTSFLQMLCWQLMLVYHHRNLWSLCTSHQDCTWTLTQTCCFQLALESLWSLGVLRLHGTQDWTLRLCVSACRTSRGPAIYFDWHLSHRPSAATSCWASAVPGSDTGEYSWYSNSQIMLLVLLFLKWDQGLPTW